MTRRFFFVSDHRKGKDAQVSYLCCQGGGEGGVVINPAALTRRRRQLRAVGAVGQELKVRLREHPAGLGLAVLAHRDADGQPLLRSQVPEEASIIQGAEVAVVTRQIGDEVVEEEVTRQDYAWDRQQEDHEVLERPKAVDLLQDVLELHLLCV